MGLLYAIFGVGLPPVTGDMVLGGEKACDPAVFESGGVGSWFPGMPNEEYLIRTVYIGTYPTLPFETKAQSFRRPQSSHLDHVYTARRFGAYLGPPHIPVWARIPSQAAHIHAQEVVDLTNTVRLQNIHEFDLLISAEAAVALRSESKSRQHPLRATTEAVRGAGRTGRVATFVTTAHEAREGRVGHC